MGTTTLDIHRARFAQLHEFRELLSSTPCSDEVILGTKRLFLMFKRYVCVRPTKKRPEIGNLLIVAPTRGGKGLLATSQLLTWGHSVIVNDIKGELFQQTAGYRSRLGEVFVIDPTGIGHRYDPLHNKHTEDEFYSSATNLLFQADEGEGRIFTQRATVMLCQLFAAARLEGVAPLPYAGTLIRLGLATCAERLNAVSPELATQFLDVRFEDANWSDRFLLSCWGTLTARMRPLLTETIVRCFTRSDFTPEHIMRSSAPVTVYLRWKEQDLLALSPLVKLLWGTLINELITTYDTTQGKGCNRILLLLDEAGRTAIPALADQSTTVVGRGIHMWVAVQSLSQLEAVYGRSRAQVLRDNMESQLYYRPTDLNTAQYLQERCGKQSAYAHSTTEREGTEVQEGLSEQPIPLLTAQDILQHGDEEIIGFHRHLPPMRLTRMDWRRHPTLSKRRNIPPPVLHALPQIADIPTGKGMEETKSYPHEYVDPDMI
jgi:type IV secretion system protein VirD4